MFDFNWATPFWAAWIVYFCVVEGMALFNSRKGDTLSEHVWTWLGYRDGRIGPPKGSERLRRYLTLGFLAWLVIHFMTGGIF